MPPTTTFDRGQVVLVRFPFSDLSSGKQRPAVVVSSQQYLRAGRDVIAAAVTGRRVDRPGPFDHVLEDWSSAGLLMPSVVRAGKLVTLERSMVRRALGSLANQDLQAVDALLREALGLRQGSS